MKNTLEMVNLNKEVTVSKIKCYRKFKNKNIRFRNYRRNKNKTST